MLREIEGPCVINIGTDAEREREMIHGRGKGAECFHIVGQMERAEMQKM